MPDARKGRALLASVAMALVFIHSALPAAAASVPRRVVSMNLCTDQMAMLVAAPGQLFSVSFLAADPVSSVLAPLWRAGRQQLHSIGSRVLLLHGADDEIVPLADVQPVVDELPGWALASFPGGKHQVFNDLGHAEVADLVGDFVLGRASARTAA